MNVKFKFQGESISASGNLAKVKATLKQIADRSQKTLDLMESAKHNTTVRDSYLKTEAKRDLAIAVLEALDGKFMNLNLEL